MEFVSKSDCISMSDTPNCALGELPPDEIVTYTVTAKVNAEVPNNTVILNEVKVTTTSEDANPDNNVASVSTGVCAAVHTEALCFIDIHLEPGTGFVASGVGLEGLDEGVITVKLPKNVSDVKQVLLYWGDRFPEKFSNPASRHTAR